MKRLQDETQNSLPGEGNGDKPMDPTPPSNGTIPNFTSEVHKIMNGLEDMDTSDMGKDGEVDVRSPAKKRHGFLAKECWYPTGLPTRGWTGSNDYNPNNHILREFYLSSFPSYS